jgi:hypothetical protein
LLVIRQPIIPPEPLPVPINSFSTLKTLLISKSICHFQNNYCKNPTKEKFQKLFKANKLLAVQYSIDQYTKEGLIELLKYKKKLYNRSKRFNLLGKEDIGIQLFSTPRVRAVQDFQAAKQAAEEKEKTRIASKKAASAVKKASKEAAKADRVLQYILAKEAKDQIEAENKAVEAAQKEKEKQAKQAAKLPKRKPTTLAKVRKVPIKKNKVVRFVGVDQEKGSLASCTKHTFTGRVVKLLQYFKN